MSNTTKCDAMRLRRSWTSTPHQLESPSMAAYKVNSLAWCRVFLLDFDTAVRSCSKTYLRRANRSSTVKFEGSVMPSGRPVLLSAGAVGIGTDELNAAEGSATVTEVMTLAIGAAGAAGPAVTVTSVVVVVYSLRVVVRESTGAASAFDGAGAGAVAIGAP